MITTSGSLLQDVLRPHALGVDKLNSKLAAASLRNSPPARHDNLDDSDDEVVGVVRYLSHRPYLRNAYTNFLEDERSRYAFALSSGLTKCFKGVVSDPLWSEQTTRTWAVTPSKGNK